MGFLRQARNGEAVFPGVMQSAQLLLRNRAHLALVSPHRSLLIGAHEGAERIWTTTSLGNHERVRKPRSLFNCCASIIMHLFS